MPPSIRSGPKRDYDRRVAAPGLALQSGIRGVGLGVLLGLADPVKEVIALIRHARAIERDSGTPPRTVSLAAHGARGWFGTLAASFLERAG